VRERFRIKIAKAWEPFHRNKSGAACLLRPRKSE
jgi:hypothetical protein